MSQNSYQTWTYEEFVAFTMLYAAGDDGEISDDEVKIIENKIGTERFNKLYKVLESNIHFDNLDIILELKDKFIKKESDLERVLESIDKIIEADGKVTKFEQDMINSISFLLKTQ